ncbi:MAG: M64 family metallopeptidase [Bacteroidota bacterium]
MRTVSSIALVLFLFTAPSVAADNPHFDHWFTGSTLRVDYYDTGTKGQEIISLDRLSLEGEWPGSRVNLVDTLNLGEYLARVYDRASNALIYSLGYSSIFNEWQTTDEALAGDHRTFSATVRIPFPKREIQLVISRRDKNMVFHELFSTTVNPNSPTAVDRSPLKPHFPVQTLVHNGPSAQKVDLLILGDGYARGDVAKFRKDAKHFNDVMFSTPPFSTHKADFNVWTIEVESPESGISIPDKNIWKGNTLGCAYNTFGSARYVLTEANKTLRDIAGAAPYDFILILVNDSRYGGGGIFQLYTTTYTNELTKGQEWQEDYMYVHEFGHSFGGLADEYYTSSTGYNDFYSAGVEPWEPNITALRDPANIKWKPFLTPGVAIPTPWPKTTYDSLETLRGKLDRLAPDYYEKREPFMKAETELLNASKSKDVVGAFEGAGYVSKGLYRPSVDCRMFSLSLTGFDPVCSAAIDRMIDWYSH